MRLAGLVICLMLCSAGVSAQQELSTIVYTSEDELQEAFLNGEIDFVQLITMIELIRFGIDSTRYYLLDEIPNLSFILGKEQLPQPKLREQQQLAFISSAEPSDRIAAVLSHSFSGKLIEGSKSRYRTSLKLRGYNGFEATIRLHREFSGSERIVYRHLKYTSRKNKLKSIVLGSFTKRLGLGTVLGYRGNILDYSTKIDSESLLFPDYGGYNGLNINFKTHNIGSELVVSYLQDSTHSLTTLAGSAGWLGEKVNPMVIASGTRITNRNSGSELDIFKYGIGSRFKYSEGYNQTEISMQSTDINTFGAFVTEGRHFFGTAEIKYAGWAYGDNFIDLTSGSKRGNLSETEEIKEVEFRYSNQRGGQNGLLFKTVVQPAEKMSLVNALIYANKNDNKYNFDILSALIITLNKKLQLRLDHISRIRDRIGSKTAKRLTRAELRYLSKNVNARTYLAYNSKTGTRDFISILASIRYDHPEFGQLYFWGKLGEINHTEGRLDYLYAFVENRYEVFENVITIVKFSHSYRRANKVPHLSTVSVGLKAQI